MAARHIIDRVLIHDVDDVVALFPANDVVSRKRQFLKSCCCVIVEHVGMSASDKKAVERGISSLGYSSDYEDDDDADKDLIGYKTKRYRKIDRRTQQLIRDGFTFDNETFSLSASAQRNWIALHDSARDGDITYPVDVSTMDDGEYTLDDLTEVLQFYSVGFGTAQGHYDSGRILKIQIAAAVDKAAVDAIEDTR